MPEPQTKVSSPISMATTNAPAQSLSKSQQQRIAFFGIGLGAPLAALPIGLLDGSGPLNPWGVAAVFVGILAYAIGCAHLAESKGYPSDYGTIAAALLLPGLIGLMLLPSKREHEPDVA